jgi:hypothetical protein
MNTAAEAARVIDNLKLSGFNPNSVALLLDAVEQGDAKAAGTWILHEIEHR